jgi:endonuclease IV
MSVLTFNASVAKKKELSIMKHPFQIMPATLNALTTNTVNQFINIDNPNILIHLSYTIRPFNPLSYQELSLGIYAKLATKINTKHILIHLPESKAEFIHLSSGMQTIYNELIMKGYIVHLEIPAWAKSLHTYFTEKETMMLDYLDPVLDIIDSFPENSCYICFDTAHLHSIGLDSDEMIKLIEKNKKYVKFIHFNGNSEPKHASDKHCPMFFPQNRIKSWEILAEYLGKSEFICIAENTKVNAKYTEWESFAKQFSFNIVPFNESLSI